MCIKAIAFCLLCISIISCNKSNEIHVSIKKDIYRLNGKDVELSVVKEKMILASGQYLYICADYDTRTDRAIKIIDLANKIQFHEVYIQANQDCQ